MEIDARVMRLESRSQYLAPRDFLAGPPLLRKDGKDGGVEFRVRRHDELKRVAGGIGFNLFFHKGKGEIR